ncbi:MAG: C4-dicarboxylate TRAP transporter substrate-binding protein [Planctomycetaceae bacterium]|nr:C4-dicarboxylate TRAP transporter substrate-binding protein [Planctomycetaceae bacterium]
MKKILGPACIIAACSLIPTSHAAAETINLTMAASHSPNLPFVGQMSKYFKPEVEKRLAASGLDIKIKWTEAYSGALYSFQNTLEAVEDNLTDIGWVGTIWESSKMPLQQITFVTPFVVDDVRIVIDVMNSLHQSIPDLRTEWQNNNQVYLGATGIGTYHTFTTFPFQKLADLKGKKINGAGLVGSWLRDTGAVPVDGGIPIFYENVKNRIVDGVLLTAQTSFAIKLHEVAPNVTQIGIGAQYVGGLSINKQVWDSLPPELRKIMSEVGLEYSKRVGAETVAKDDAALIKMGNANANVTTLPPAERTKWINTLPDLPAVWIKGAARVNQDEAAKKMLNAYLAEMKKRGQTPARDWSK